MTLMDKLTLPHNYVAIRPIIFSAPMVRALLEGRKTQTRRVAKFVTPQQDGTFHCHNGGGGMVNVSEKDVPSIAPDYAPYAFGDLLYVREAFREMSGGAIYDAAGGCFDRVEPEILYRADERSAYRKWKPSIHMPRWASRLTLAVTGVRVQRLNEISEEDSICEGILRGDPLPQIPSSKGTIWHSGVEATLDDGFAWTRQPKMAFLDLWQSIHGPGSWEQNPWVVAVSFTVHKTNVDHIADAGKKVGG